MRKKKHGGTRDGAGRPQANPEGKATVVTASVPSGLVDQMDAIAKLEEWNRSQAVTEAIRLLLKRYAKKLKASVPSVEQT